MLLTVCLKFQTRFLGSKKPNDRGIRQINYNPDGNAIIYMASFWKGLKETAEELGINNFNRTNVQIVNYIRVNPKTPVSTYIYTNSSTGNKINFECYPAGTCAYLDCKINTDAISIEGFTSVLELYGTFHGLSQYGSKWGYGHFTVESVTNNTSLTSPECAIRSNNTESDTDIIASNMKISDDLLIFSSGNAKLNLTTSTISLPAGHSCPFAKQCFAKVELDTNEKYKLVRGKDTKFNCYAAILELVRGTLRKTVWHNFNLLNGKSFNEMYKIIDKSLNYVFTPYIRIHVSGDFFNEDYFRAWLKAIAKRPNQTFYCYTKALPFWIKNKKKIPKNLILTASYGGRWDSLIKKYHLKSAKVYFHPEDAEKDGVQIDHDDSLARDPSVKSFGLLLHGVQSKGTEAAKALTRMRKENIKFSY